MLPPQIIVFATENTDIVIQWFTRQNYAFLVDGVHGQDPEWAKRELKTDHRFYQVNYFHALSEHINVSHYEWDGHETGFPDFLIVYGEGQVLDENSWDRIDEFVKELVFQFNEEERSFHFNTDMQDIMPRIIQETVTWDKPEGEKFDSATVSKDFGEVMEGVITDHVAPDLVPVEEGYLYETRYIAKRDTMIYQVNRPGTERPFTVVTNMFDIKGHKPFFTSIFASNDWAKNRIDACRYDIPFLERVWTFHEMVGPFDIDSMLKDATEACYPSKDSAGEVEPVVYRHDIDHVIILLGKRDHGFIDEEEESENIENLKKRKL